MLSLIICVSRLSSAVCRLLSPLVGRSRNIHISYKSVVFRAMNVSTFGLYSPSPSPFTCYNILTHQSALGHKARGLRIKLICSLYFTYIKVDVCGQTSKLNDIRRTSGTSVHCQFRCYEVLKYPQFNIRFFTSDINFPRGDRTLTYPLHTLT